MKLPNLNPEKVIKIIESRGFILDRVKGSHHIYINPETRQRVVIPVHKKIFQKAH